MKRWRVRLPMTAMTPNTAMTPATPTPLLVARQRRSWLWLVVVIGACRAPVAAPVRDAASTTSPRREPIGTVHEVAPALYAIDLAGSKAKAIVVERADHLVVLEMPVHDAGGNARVLVDDAAAGERVLALLQERFSGKPVRMLLSSHWHPHSLSALAPFRRTGATLVTTPASFARIVEMLPADEQPGVRAAARPPAWVRFVTDDRVELADAEAPIVLHRFTKDVVPSLPTEDYLFFELPRHQLVHVGCMYNRWDRGQVLGKELVTSRMEDLHQALEKRGIAASWLVRIDDERVADPRLPRAQLASAVATGVRARELSARYRGLSLETLRADRARLLEEAVAGGVPPSIFNGLAYESLAAGDLPAAIELATLQVLIAPGDVNAWDTLGEIHWAAGARTAARAFADQARRLDSTYAGGEAVWAKSGPR